MRTAGNGVLLSCRASRMKMSFALTYQFEDVLAELLGLVVRSRIVPTNGVARRASTAAYGTSLVRRRRQAADIPMVVAVAQNLSALTDHLRDLRLIDRGRLRVAYVEELWRAQLPLRAEQRALLNRFDHVFVGMTATCPVLAEQIRPPVSYLPHAVDAWRFIESEPPRRVIDVYAMGRRNPRHHQILLRRAEERGSLYLYDTFARNPVIKTHVHHRRNLVDLLRRTNVFMVNQAKVDEEARSAHQPEVGYRYFEGAAGGAVLVGQRPDTPVF
jgi:hypothetical protein